LIASSWVFNFGVILQTAATSIPLFLAGVLSAEIKPTPNPAKNLPARNSGMEVAAVCKITPKLNTQLEAIWETP
jgi:hypothetical protein